MFSNVLCIGDPHFKNSCLDESRELHKKTIETIKQNNYDAVIILGDVMDRHALIDMVPFCMALEYVNDIAKLSKVFMLVGNHDISHNKVNIANESNKSHSLLAFKYIANVVVVDEPYYINILGLNCCLLPYYPVGEFPDIDADILFCHQEFKGCKMNGLTSKHGDIINGNDKLIISGHIHDFQVLKNNIIYPGTPFMVSFGENADKGFIVLSQYNEESWMKYKNMSINRINLSIIPKLVYRCNAGEFKDILIKANQLKNSKVKIIVSDTEQNISTLNTSCNHIVVTKIIKTETNIKIDKNFERKTLNDYCMELLNDSQKLFIKDILNL